MAWWYARLLFHGDRLVDAGLHDAMPPAAEVVDPDAELLPAADAFTSVCVSGYALYGRLRGYYALGVGHFRLDPATGRALATEAAINHTEPVSSLSPRQRAVVGDWLEAQSPEAWASSLERFREVLAPDLAAEPFDAAPPPNIPLRSVGALHAP